MTEYHKFSQLKDKFPTLDSNNVDYTTAVGCRKTLRWTDDWLAVAGTIEHGARISETLRVKFNLKHSGTVVDIKFTQDEFFMTKDQFAAHTAGESGAPMTPYTPGVSPTKAKYSSPSVAYENTVRKIQQQEQESYSPEEVADIVKECLQLASQLNQSAPSFHITS